MSTAPREHLQELLAERALFGLGEEEMGELHTLTAGKFDEFNEYELAAAALDLAFHSRHGHESMPADLRVRTLTAVRRAAAAPRREPVVAVGPLAAPAAGQVTPASLQRERGAVGTGVNFRESLAWITAAAAILVAAFLFSRQPTVEESSPIALYQNLSRSADATRVKWSPGNDELGQGVEGEIVWSDRRQQGVMRFEGLKANDPRQYQYQLWIFDASRDEKYPVDGGVFDVPAGQQEVLIPIDPRVPVSKATLFAVSVEKPGGTVVSDRSRLPLVAPVPADEAKKSDDPAASDPPPDEAPASDADSAPAA